MDERELATIQKITAINPIPDADKIEVADILGWHVVVQKNEFKVGDVVVYVEVDALLPNEDWCSFLRPTARPPRITDFVITTRRFRKQISQGIIFPLGILPVGAKVKVGMCVDKILGIKLYEPFKKPVRKYQKPKEELTFWERIKEWWFQRTYWKNQKKKQFPTHLVPKTSETRIQNAPFILTNFINSVAVWTEKVDGCSGTYILYKGKFIVCSRNHIVKNGGYNSEIYWKAAQNDEIEKKLRNYKKNIAIQCEIIGKGSTLDSRIGKNNKYDRPQLETYVFNIRLIDENRYANYYEFLKISKQLRLRTVPILQPIVLPPTVDEMVALSEGKSLINPKQIREGVVVRSLEMNGDKWFFSFKCLSPKFLLQPRNDTTYE